VSRVPGCQCGPTLRSGGLVTLVHTCPKCLVAAKLSMGIDLAPGTRYRVYVSVSGVERIVQKEFRW